MFLEKHCKLIAILIGAALAVISVVSWFYLPSKLIMQMKLDGSVGIAMPSVAGLAILFALTAALLWRMVAVKTQKEKRQWLIGAAFVFFVDVVLIGYNITL